METLINILVVLASVLLILVILIQNPKGGGLSSEVGSAAQLGGVAKTTDTIEKTTWFLAAFIMVLSLASSKFFVDPTQSPLEGEQIEQGEE